MENNIAELYIEYMLTDKNEEPNWDSDNCLENIPIIPDDKQLWARHKTLLKTGIFAYGEPFKLNTNIGGRINDRN